MLVTKNVTNIFYTFWAFRALKEKGHLFFLLILAVNCCPFLLTAVVVSVVVLKSVSSPSARPYFQVDLDSNGLLLIGPKKKKSGLGLIQVLQHSSISI